jgi:hypothetical protein
MRNKESCISYLDYIATVIVILEENECDKITNFPLCLTAIRYTGR